MILHVVKPGETPISIANTYGVNVYRMLRENGLNEYTPLVVGQCIVIVFPKTLHTVRANETLFSIAQYYGTTITRLYRNNPDLGGRPQISVGQELVIDFDEEKQGALSVNSYAYTFISDDLVYSQIPYLTYLTPFTYGFTESGALVQLNDDRLLAIIAEFETKPLMHLSTLTENGNFSNELAHIALTEQAVQQALIQNVLDTLRAKGYFGLDVDFEFVYAEDASLYAAFIQNLRDTLNPAGYEVIAALAPKISDDQPGLLYQGHDFRAIGNAANAVFLMTYEWGYTYGPPQAVAPIPNVRQVLDYAIVRIPRDKVFMGVPTYGYDWTLPYVRGVTKAQSISNPQAIALAGNYNAVIQYDQSAQSPFFYYSDGLNDHVVWFEDGRSIAAKLALIPEYGFQGIGYWNLLRPFPQNWLILNTQYNIRIL